MKSYFLTITLFVVTSLLYAQRGFLPRITAQDFQITSALIDTSAHAIVLFEKGQSEIDFNKLNVSLFLQHRYSVRIKILDQEGFDHANRTIPLFKYNRESDEINQIKCTTHHLDNGNVTSVNMDNKSVFNEKVNDRLTLTKFTLPDLKENCIIDIEYTIRSPEFFNFKSWYFQEDIPKIHSEYITIIPDNFTYNIAMRGYYPLTDRKVEKHNGRVQLGNESLNSNIVTYTMKDVPAFKEESYMLSSENFKSAIHFELRQFRDLNFKMHNYTKQWSDVDKELLEDLNFGGQIKQTGIFKKALAEIIHADDSEETKAHKIFNYIKQQIKWNESYGRYSIDGVKKVLERRTGSVGDINLALLAALNAANIECYPVILATRNLALPGLLHPVITDFNYVIAYVKIGEQTYFLDASEKHLPFGELPLRCINGSGRVIRSKTSSEWVELENKEPSKVFYHLIGNLDTTGKFDGKLTISYQGLSAISKRNKIASFTSIEEYMDDLIENFTNMRVENGKILNLDNLNEILIEELDVTLDMSASLKEKSLVINPILIEKTTKNPFNLEERTYPVDLGAKFSESHMVTIYLPEGYTIEDKPKNMALALPEQAARFSYQSDFSENTLHVSQTLNLNKAIFMPDEYFDLKEFFSRIIQHQKIDFTFKK